MNLGPCRVSASCCFTTGLGAGGDLEHGAEPAVWPQSQERKQGLAHGASAGVGGLVRAGRAGGSLAGGSCGALPVPFLVLHPTAPTTLCLICQHMVDGQSGAGEALGSGKAASAHGGWGSVGLGAAGHRLPGPPRPCMVQTCPWLLLWFLSCNSANPSLSSAPLPWQVPPKPWGNTSCCGGLWLPFSSTFCF